MEEAALDQAGELGTCEENPRHSRHPRQGLARIGLQNQRLLSLEDFSSLVKLLDLGEVPRFIQRN